MSNYSWLWLGDNDRNTKTNQKQQAKTDITDNITCKLPRSSIILCKYSSKLADCSGRFSIAGKVSHIPQKHITYPYFCSWIHFTNMPEGNCRNCFWFTRTALLEGRLDGTIQPREQNMKLQDTALCESRDQKQLSWRSAHTIYCLVLTCVSFFCCKIFTDPYYLLHHDKNRNNKHSIS